MCHKVLHLPDSDIVNFHYAPWQGYADPGGWEIGHERPVSRPGSCLSGRPRRRGRFAGQGGRRAGGGALHLDRFLFRRQCRLEPGQRPDRHLLDRRPARDVGTIRRSRRADFIFHIRRGRRLSPWLQLATRPALGIAVRLALEAGRPVVAIVALAGPVLRGPVVTGAIMAGTVITRTVSRGRSSRATCSRSR